jgi:hypothetical protein
VPIYTFECQACEKRVDEFFKMDDCPDAIPCACGVGVARKIIACGHIQCDDIINVTWLDEAARNASNDHRHGRRKIETRKEYYKFLKDNGLRETTGINLTEV